MVFRYGLGHMLLVVPAPAVAAELAWKAVPNLAARAWYAVGVQQTTLLWWLVLFLMLHLLFRKGG